MSTNHNRTIKLPGFHLEMYPDRRGWFHLFGGRFSYKDVARWPVSSYDRATTPAIQIGRWRFQWIRFRRP